MLTEGRKVLVHIYDCMCREISTRNFGKEFEVKKECGQLGIDWNTEKLPYCNNGNVFSPFHTFASNVIFEDVENGRKYHYCTITNSIVENTTE